MQFAEADLQEFVRIWKKEFQESISLEEARHAASLLMELYVLLLAPVRGASPLTPESSLNDHRT